MRQAVRWQLLSIDPTQGVQLPRQLQREMSAFNVDQAQLFLKTALNSPFACLFAVALTSGMRPSEYLALSWPDINWQKGTASVVRTLHKVEGEWVFEEVKRKRSRRVIKLQTWVLDMLQNMKAQRRKSDQSGDSRFKELIFITTFGQPIREEHLVKKHFKPILLEAGLPNIRLYDLRHTCATLAVSLGVSPKVISEQLGHASAAFTLDTYAHVLPHMQDEAAAKMEVLLTNGISFPR